MTQTSTSLLVFLERIALPFALFGGVFCGAMTASTIFVLPELTAVEIGAQEREVSELPEYHAVLTASVVALEHERTALLQPLRGTVYEELWFLKQSQPNAYAAYSSLLQAVNALEVPENAITIDAITIAVADKTARITGVVQSVGPRSLTVLAQFVEAMRGLPLVAGIEPPVFEKKQTDDGAFYSPIDMVLHLTTS